MEFMFCSNCGKRIKTASKFCPYCGETVDLIEQSASAQINSDKPSAAPARPVIKQRYIEIPKADATPSEPVFDKILKKDIEKTAKKANAALSILLCFVIALLSFVCVAVSTVRNMATEEGIEQVMEDISISEIQVGVEKRGGNPVTVSDYAYWYLDGVYDIGLTRRDLAEVIDDSSVKNYIAEIAADLVKDLYNGTTRTKITEEKLIRLLAKNDKLLDSGITYELREIMVEQIMKSEMVELINDGDLFDSDGFGAVKLLPIFTSTASIVIMIILILACVYLLLRINGFSLIKPTCNTGISLVCGGGFFALITVIAVILSLFIDSANMNVYYVVGAIADALLMGLAAAIVTVVVGVALILVAVAMRKYVVKKQAVKAE